mgnify:FL=1
MELKKLNENLIVRVSRILGREEASKRLGVSERKIRIVLRNNGVKPRSNLNAPKHSLGKLLYDSIHENNNYMLLSHEDREAYSKVAEKFFAKFFDQEFIL